MSARSLSIPAVAILVLGFAPPGGAAGPFGYGSLPGDVQFVDDDPGNGEQWGRSGGRNYSFSNFDLSLFTGLVWGPVDGNSVAIAFDGTVNTGTAEYLSYSAGQSSLASGLAVWVGSTQVQLFPGLSIAPVDTRFELRVTDGFGNPVPLSFDPVRGMPQLDVLTTAGQFNANLRMLAKLTSSSTFQPALDLFDALDTNPTQTELAQTSFVHGFFIESVTALSLDEHDANMFQQTDQILGDLDFLKIEAVGGFSGLRQKVDDYGNQASSQLFDLQGTNAEILSRLSAVGAGIDGLAETTNGQILNNLLEILARIDGLTANGGLATGVDVEVARQDIQRVRGDVADLLKTLLILWGIEFDAQGNPDPSTLRTIRSLASQQSVDGLHLKSDLLSTLVVDQTAALSSQQSVDEVRDGIGALLSQDQACASQVGALLDRLAELEAALETSAQQQLELQVAPSPRSSKKHERLVIFTSEAGQPVETLITSVMAIPDKQGFEPVPVPFDVQPVAPGLVDIEVLLPRSLRSTSLLLIQAEHDHPTGAHHGSVLQMLDGEDSHGNR